MAVVGVIRQWVRWTLAVTLIATLLSRPGEMLFSEGFNLPARVNTYNHETLGSDMGNQMIDGGGGRSRGGRGGAFGGTGDARKARPASKTIGPRGPVAIPRVSAPNNPPAGKRYSAPSRGYSAPNSGGGGGLGTGATGTIAAQGMSGFAAEEPPAPPPMSEDQWLAQDAGFIDEKAAANADFENLMAKLANQRTDYELDNKNTNRNLGWNGKEWNEDDRLTGYGNAFQNQLNDFSSRGMVDSSLFGEAQNDLNRGFNQQRDDLATQLANFISGQATDKAAAGSARDQAITAAQRQSLQRFAAQQGLI